MDNWAKADNDSCTAPTGQPFLRSLGSMTGARPVGVDKPWVAGLQSSSSILAGALGKSQQEATHSRRVAFAEVGNNDPHQLPELEMSEEPLILARGKAPGERSRVGRRSLTSQEDMQKLLSSYDSLNQQWQLTNTRKDTIGSGEAPSQPQQQPAQVLLQPPTVGPAPTPSMSLLSCLPGDHSSSHYNECILGSKDSKSSEKLFQFPSNVTSSKARESAAEIFEDAELVKLCDEGLSKQLQRTKDGATEQSRIQELAALVKLLRKCVRELGSRASMYVDQCIKLEKELAKQMETVRLSAETTVKSLEAEFAQAKSNLAQAESSLKKERATWGSDLETQKFEVNRLKRELERMMEERDKAREDSLRAEQVKQQLDAELKELRKQTNQQMREVAVSQNEAVRTVTEEKTAAEKRESALREENKRLQQRLSAITTCVEELQSELAVMRQVNDNHMCSLRIKESGEQCLSQQMQQLQQELRHTQGQLGSAQEQCKQLTDQLQEALQTKAALESQLASSSLQRESLQQKVLELSSCLDSERAAWALKEQQLKAAHAQAAELQTSTENEKNMLKTALAAALSQKESSQAELSSTQREVTILNHENANLKNQVEFVSGQQAEIEQREAAARQQLHQCQDTLNSTKEVLERKEARLEHLEGEFAALKEVLGDAGQRDVVNNLLSKISTLQSAVAASDSVRRKLHNELVEIRGNIRVYCRVRPHPTSAVKCASDQTSVSIAVEGKENGFGYDRVFGPESTQEEVFASVSELVQSALDGYHVCLFSYGQTGAGKTFTMQGNDSSASKGIIPRSVEKILESAQKLADQDWEFSMEASFIEIYNNMLRDLLGHGTTYISDQNAIKHDPNGGHTTVIGISKVPVTDAATADQLIRKASAARACEATAMNAVSSRSHSIFMLYITGFHAPTGTRLQGCLCLVDLAGSERLDRSQVEEQRKKEACAINQSLSSLGDVFQALSSKTAHIPYRNSKLTYLLQPCLGGHGKTLMFVNINPEPASAPESLCSLKFAAKVNGCETGAKGGAKRNVSAPGAALPSTGDAAGAKRLSLPGPPRAAMPEPAAKRMSMTGPQKPAGGSGAAAVTGVKRVAASSGIPTAGPAKKTKP